MNIVHIYVRPHFNCSCNVCLSLHINLHLYSQHPLACFNRCIRVENNHKNGLFAFFTGKRLHYKWWFTEILLTLRVFARANTLLHTLYAHTYTNTWCPIYCYLYMEWKEPVIKKMPIHEFTVIAMMRSTKAHNKQKKIFFYTNRPSHNTDKPKNSNNLQNVIYWHCQPFIEWIVELFFYVFWFFSNTSFIFLLLNSIFFHLISNFMF